MIQRIKTWFSNYREKRRKKQTLKIIKKAKQALLNDYSPFICCCFYYADPSFKFDYNNIVDKIPEFKPETFGFTVGDLSGGWWAMSDKKSRIKAFDILIGIYSK